MVSWEVGNVGNIGHNKLIFVYMLALDPTLIVPTLSGPVQAKRKSFKSLSIVYYSGFGPPLAPATLDGLV